MEKLNVYGNKIFYYFPGFIFGFIAISIGLTGYFISMILYPGYSMMTEMVSTLGIGPGAIYFNLGTVLSGIIAIPFYFDLGRLVYNENDHQKLLRIALINSTLSCIALAFVGVFPAIQNSGIIIILHYLTAILSWLTGVVYCIIFGILMLRSLDYPKALAYYGFFPGSIILIYLVLIVLSLIPIPFAVAIVPITEWIIVFAIILFIGINSTYMLYKKIIVFNNKKKA